MSKPKEKRISEWLEELPEPIRTKALDNFKEQNCKNIKVSSLLSAIAMGFVWSKTPEGSNYWNSFKPGNTYNKIELDLLSEDFILLFEMYIDNSIYEWVRNNKSAQKVYTFDKKKGWILRDLINYKYHS